MTKPQKPEVPLEEVREVLDQARRDPAAVRPAPGGDVAERLRQHDDALVCELEKKVLALEAEIEARTRAEAVLRTAHDRSDEMARQKVARLRRELDVVSDVAASPSLADGDVRGLAVELTEAAACALEVERVGVWLFDEGGTRLVAVDNYLASTGVHSAGAVLFEHEFRSEFDALRSAKYVDADDPSSDPRTAGYVEGYIEPNRITAMLDAVIRHGGQSLGTLCFEHVARPHHWEDDEIAFACQLADQVALAISNRDRMRAEEEIRKERMLSNSIIHSLPGIFYLFDEQGRFLRWNENFEKAVGRSAAEIARTHPLDLFDGAERELLRERIAEVFRSGVSDAEASLTSADGSRTPYYFTGLRSQLGGRTCLIGMGIDLTDRKRTEEERQKLQAQLLESQKMEAIGRLAGGVAHDFNNLLSVVLSYASFAIDAVREGDPLRADLEEIRKAGERAATLTRQLLAFSRKLVLEPVVLDLNAVVGGIESMLRRLLGEDIDIEVHLAEDLGSVLADPGQLEQVIMNLAVNARDAMPRGGKLTLVTANAVLDESFADRHVGVGPGRFVMLSVTDTGCGMDAETREHIFEPFFTTKEKGKGTGLGLATVHGIVEQSGGSIWVYSEPGLGTTFKVYLPQVGDRPADISRRPGPAVATGSETVLVVEDEDAVRRLAVRILQSAGYQVHAASNAGEALLLCERLGGEIDLLLTDVVMPQVSGRELAERLSTSYPKLEVLYMSGHTDDAVVHHGVLAAKARFIGKPFSAAELTRKVREALDAD